MDDTLVVTGTVLDVDGTPVSGAVVEVWDQDLLEDDPLGHQATDNAGKFSVEFTESAFSNAQILDRRPDLYFRVFRRQQLVYTSEANVLQDVEGSPFSVVLRLGTGVQTARPPLLSERSVDAMPNAIAAFNRKVTAAEFGECFVKTVFDPETLKAQTAALIGAREFRQVQEQRLGPVQIHVTTTASVADPQVERIGRESFDVTIPVLLHVEVQGKLGFVDASENYRISAQARFRYTIHLFDSLTLFIEASRVTPGHLQLDTQVESGTALARSEVERGVRVELAKRFNESLLASRAARTIDLRREVARFLQERLAPPQ
ncbi:MAG TPA: hypothetical protein VK524_08750 [Polyangiaceae bacterium]|nr:hypothetical protein [Polyangiaceae bacterium]